MPPLEDLLGGRMNVSVLRLLSRVQGGLSGNAAARWLGAQQSTVRKALERLVALGVVTRTDVGRAAVYEIDTRRAVVTHVILPLFQAEGRLQVALREELAAVVSRIAPPPVVAVLFGSAALHARAPRDVDLLLVVREEAEVEPVRSSLVDEAERFETEFQLPIDPVILTRAELEDPYHARLIARVAVEGRLLAGHPIAPFHRLRSPNAPLGAL